MAAARKGNLELASQYLNTTLRGEDAQLLAQQLFIVLDRRLPARLLVLSDRPEGSLSTLNPDEDPVGTIPSVQGDVEILVERVPGGRTGHIWLFSKQTLDKIPDLFNELDEVRIDKVLPKFLSDTKIAGVSLFNYVGVFVVLPALYLLLSLLSRALGLLLSKVRRGVVDSEGRPLPRILSPPVRLLLLVLFIYVVLSKFALPLFAREFWATFAVVIAIVACMWLAFRFNRTVENLIRRRLASRGKMKAIAVFQLGHRLVDLAAILAGGVIVFYALGFNPTTTLAGLGIGGVAIALAAKTTLENVLGGISLISDGVIRVGDEIKFGDTLGTVEAIGLRSTRVRTKDRTVVSVPNGHMANLNLESITSRDKFWFHPVIKLRYDTTAAQAKFVLDGMRRILAEHPLVDPASVRVRLHGFAASALELDIVAYAKAKNKNHFLELQEELLLKYMEAIQAAGTQLAFPAAVYVASAPAGVEEQLAAMKSVAS
jgi:MscS family membrane protein